jgi:23S rRNA (adenine2503-C2)-methyltransferase
LPETASVHKSPDGNTHKFVIRLADGARVESVSMRTPKRLTFCISSQVGCALQCSFCATGLMGLKRNLKAHEIVAQVVAMGEFHGWQDDRFNIVFMGMGEPLANMEAVTETIRILHDENGLNLGARRLTVSTSGLVPQIRELTKLKLQVGLAISLHATTDALRDEIYTANLRAGIGALKTRGNYRGAWHHLLASRYPYRASLLSQAKLLIHLLLPFRK